MKDRMKNPFTLGSSEAFFFTHAGYSYDAKIETRKQGRMRCAVDLASAERFAQTRDWEFEWESDWSIGSHQKFYGKDSAYEDSEPGTCESCVLRDSDGNALESLGCIDDADSNYRRVIEAELASEAMYREASEQLREIEVESFVNRCYAL